jgi:hypothetical protein
MQVPEGRIIRKWEDNIKIDFKEIFCDVEYRIYFQSG